MCTVLLSQFFFTPSSAMSSEETTPVRSSKQASPHQPPVCYAYVELQKLEEKERGNRQHFYLYNNDRRNDFNPFIKAIQQGKGEDVV